MKWIIFIFVIGVIEVWSTGELHAFLGMWKLVVLYMATTATGVLFLYTQLPEFRESMRVVKKIEKKWKRKFKNSEYKPTSDDMEKLRPILFVGIYIYAAVLIAIPGIISDIFGLILLLSGNQLINHRINRALADAKQEI